MRARVWRIFPFLAAVVALAGWGAGCTDADPFPITDPDPGERDDRLTVTGTFCTDHPDEIRAPVKILFIVDCSGSMDGNDPQPTPSEPPGRVRAVQEVIESFGATAGVSFAILRFEGGANVVTQVSSTSGGPADTFGFTADPVALARGLDALWATGGLSSYQAALGLAEATLAMDMSETGVDERTRARYVVVFLTDGKPDPVDYDDDVNTPASIQRAVRAIMSLADRFEVRDLRVHTSYLSADPTEPVSVREEAESLLRTMAEIGEGTFRNFRNGEEINFLHIDFTSIKRTYVVKDGAFLVSNLNARPAAGQAASVDTDADGLVDALEEEAGTSPVRADTDGDGFGDLLEYHLRTSGFDPLDPDDADCVLALDKMDRDGDGLLDCEERFLGTSSELFDSDSDGLPDPVEYRSGTNWASADAGGDQDFDGSLNGQEVAWHTNPRQEDAAQFPQMAYRYRYRKLPGWSEGRTCYEFEVRNITLVGTQSLGGDSPAGFNDIRVYAGQIPIDDPTGNGQFRVACARVRYVPRPGRNDLKIPPSGRVEFVLRDFKRPVPASCEADADCPHHVCDPSNHTCQAPLGERCDPVTPCPPFACVIDPATGTGACDHAERSACTADEDCPRRPCDHEVGRCRMKACRDSRECPHRRCVGVLGACAGMACGHDDDCRTERGYTCSPLVGDPCSRDIDCPFEFCDLEVRECTLGASPCSVRADCPDNVCDPGTGLCTQETGRACTSDVECSVNECRRRFVCANDPTVSCTTSIDCPPTFCRADGVCLNDTSITCNPLTENVDDNCRVGMCSRDGSLGRCDTAGGEPCSSRAECPPYRCNLSVNRCYYPSPLACATVADCPEPGMECDRTGFCIARCDRDTDCPLAQCQGRCVPPDSAARRRCTDWMDLDRDCLLFE